MFDRAVKTGGARAISTELMAYMARGALLAVGDRLALDDAISREQAIDAYLILRGTRQR